MMKTIQLLHSTPNSIGVFNSVQLSVLSACNSLGWHSILNSEKKLNERVCPVRTPVQLSTVINSSGKENSMTEKSNAVLDISQHIADIEEEERQLQRKCRIEGKHIVFGKDYRIALNRCDTYPKITHWIVHLCSKRWIDKAMLQRFVILACKENGLDVYGNMWAREQKWGE